MIGAIVTALVIVAIVGGIGKLYLTLIENGEELS